MLNLCVNDLLFRDIEGSIVLFVRARKVHHKGRRSKGNSWEHVRVDTSPIVLSLQRMVTSLPPSFHFFQGTPATFRKRCDQIFLQDTGVPKSCSPVPLGQEVVHIFSPCGRKMLRVWLGEPGTQTGKHSSTTCNSLWLKMLNRKCIRKGNTRKTLRTRV